MNKNARLNQTLRYTVTICLQITKPSPWLERRQVPHLVWGSCKAVQTTAVHGQYKTVMVLHLTILYFSASPVPFRVSSMPKRCLFADGDVRARIPAAATIDYIRTISGALNRCSRPCRDGRCTSAAAASKPYQSAPFPNLPASPGEYSVDKRRPRKVRVGVCIRHLAVLPVQGFYGPQN